MDIEQVLKKKNGHNDRFEPFIFDLTVEEDQKKLRGFVENNHIQFVIDEYVDQLLELFEIRNPSKVYTSEFKTLFDEHIKKLKEQQPLWQQGRWIFYPWNTTLVHVLREDEFLEVRTARNKHLITEEEQSKFYDSVIGIGGLSVGNSVALATVLQGGGKQWKLADHDILALSNTNRIRAGIQHLGLPKVVMTARQMYEINPYLKVEIFPEGITEKNIQAFIEGPAKLDIIIDELDNFAIKYRIREYAKKNMIPVLSALDNGDNGIVDIERHDQSSDIPFFQGRIGDVSYDTLKTMGKFEIGKTITQYAGPENVTEAMQQSMLAIGKSIVSWPQLGGAALMNGSAVAYCIRKILNNQDVESNRAIISLDEKLVPNFDSTENRAKRKKIADEFKKLFGL